MTRRAPTLWLLSLCAGFFICGCKPEAENAASPTAAASARKVVFLAARTDTPFEAAQRQFLMQLLANQRRATLQTEDATGNAATQAAQLKKLITDKPFAIIVDPVDPSAIAGPVADAASAGILVIGLGKDATAAPCSTVLFSDQRELGRLAAETAIHALTLKAHEEGRNEVTGRVVEIRGADGSSASAQRHEGFVAALKGTPGIIIVHDAPGGWTRKGGKERAEEALRVQHSFDAIYAHNDSMALGASEALGDQRDNVLVIGSDGFRGPEGGFTLVENGNLDATVYRPLLVDFAWSIIRKKMDKPDLTLQPSYELHPEVVSPRKLDDFRRNGMAPFPKL